MTNLLREKAISEAYKSYRERIEDKVQFFKQSKEYIRRGSGDTNLWKLFLERSLKLAGEDGSFALVIPSGIITDEGAKQLRESLFQGTIHIMYEFENKMNIFPDIDARTKFVLLVADKSQAASSFPAAFYLHDIDSLQGKTEKEKFLEISIDLVKKSAPVSLSIPEIRNKEQLAVFSHIYDSNPLLSDSSKGWITVLVTELHRTADSDLFKTDNKGWCLADGKSFHQFVCDYEKSVFSVDPSKTIKRLSGCKEYDGIVQQIHEMPRLAFRAIASSTNVRTVIACILPPNTVSDHNVSVIIPKKGMKRSLDSVYYKLIAYLSGILNSYVFDFLVRTRISIYFSFYIFYQTPVPAEINSPIAKQIEELSAILSSCDDRFLELAKTFGLKPVILNMRERIELTAKLNALVAKHYGLNRQQLQVILNSFEGFEEDKELVNMKEVQWDDTLIRKFNGEVRKRVLPIFEQLNNETSKV